MGRPAPDLRCQHVCADRAGPTGQPGSQSGSGSPPRPGRRRRGAAAARRAVSTAASRPRPRQRPAGLPRVAGASPGIKVASVDLPAGIDVARASHRGYAGNVARAAGALPQPVSLCGWSMGGLVVLQATRPVRPHTIILLEPSPPAEVQGVNLAVEIKTSTFDPEETYGPFPHDIRARPEASRARDQRERRTTVPWPPCPALVVYGDD